MNIFPVFHLPKLCYLLIVTYFVFVYHVVTLAYTYLPVVFLNFKFQISNCNVFVYVTLAFYQVSIVTV